MFFFHCFSLKNAYGAAVLVKLSLAKSGRAIDRSCSNHIAAVDLQSAHGTFRFISLYLRLSFNNTVDQFNSDLSSLFSKLSIIAIDSNAFSKVWFSRLTNSRGLDLELLITKHFSAFWIIHWPNLNLCLPALSFSTFLSQEVLSSLLAGSIQQFPPSPTTHMSILKSIVPRHLKSDMPIPKLPSPYFSYMNLQISFEGRSSCQASWISINSVDFGYWRHSRTAYYSHCYRF